MFCWKCGKEVSPNSKFCECCGSALNNGQVENTTDIPIQKKKRNKKRVIPVIIAVLLVTIGVGGFFINKNLPNNLRVDESSTNEDTQRIYLITQKNISFPSEGISFKHNVEYDEQGNKLSYKHFIVKDGIETNDWAYSYSYDYDNNGYLIASNEHSYSYDYDDNGGLVSSDTSVTRFEYTNDSNGLELNSSIYKNGEFNSRYEKKYDNKNHLLSLVSYTDDGSIKARLDYEYDTKGNLIKEQQMNFVGNGSDQATYYIDNYHDIRYMYSEGNCLISKTSRYYVLGDSGNFSIDNGSNLKMGEYSEQKVDYIYDNNGNSTEEHFYDNGALIMRITYQYEGNQLKKKSVYSNSNSEPSITIYTYDDNGNCISEEWYDSEGSMTKRNEYVYVHKEVSTRQIQKINNEQEALRIAST